MVDTRETLGSSPPPLPAHVELAREPSVPVAPSQPARADSSPWRHVRRWWALIAGGLFALLKFAKVLKLAKLGAVLVKAGPVMLKTGATMILSLGAYALVWGWKYALGVVLLLLVHELGHLIVARRLGLAAGAPVFIPFMGAFIALKDQPRNVWVEAQVGIGGPIAGAVGALACHGLYLTTHEPLFAALAFSGYFLNLFNLTPIGFLDGGRVIGAISPWLMIVGVVAMLAMLFARFNPIVLLVLVMSVPRVWALFRKRSDAEKSYFEVTKSQRISMGVTYVWLVALLWLGMHVAHVPAPS